MLSQYIKQGFWKSTVPHTSSFLAQHDVLLAEDSRYARAQQVRPQDRRSKSWIPPYWHIIVHESLRVTAPNTFKPLF